MGLCLSYPYSVYIVTERNQTILTTYHLDRAEAMLQAPCRELIVYSPDQPNRRPILLYPIV